MTYNFTSAVAGGNQTYTYSWNFGDGGTSAAANPSHTYTTAGSYAVTLVVADSASHAVTSNTINITLYAPLAVSASATPSTLIVGNSVTFNAVATGGNGVYSYAWTFGDGGTGSGATVNHTYATKGTYTAHVVVTDGASHTVTSANLTITVKPVPPEIVASEKLTDPFRIKLLGVNFQSGCTATINGTPVTVSFKNSGKIILKNCSSLCPNGVPVQIVVTNPDGGVSNPYQFVR
jgi:PKD repeat protein